MPPSIHKLAMKHIFLKQALAMMFAFSRDLHVV